MKILLLGANGQVGRELCEVVRGSNNKEIELIDRDRSQLDITQEEQVNQQIAEIQPSIVINAAAYTAVDQAEQETEIAFAVNRAAPAHIAKACAKYDIPLLHISTDYVFDGEKAGAYSEIDTVNPKSVYGQSKWEGEEAIRKHLDRHIILRTSWVFGVYGKNFVYTMLRLAQQREELRVVNDQHGCPTSANSIANALVNIGNQVLNGVVNAWGTYHYCGQPETTWFHFAETIIESSKESFDFKVKRIEPISTSEFPTPAKRPKNSVLNCEKIHGTFDIEQVNWKHDLEKMIQHPQFAYAHR